jgi:hypothetical protein
VTLNTPTFYTRTHRYSIFTLTGLILILTISRIINLSGLELHTDEVWSIWQTFGTPEQIIRWTPYDWPPLYYLILGGWRGFVGIQPIGFQYLSTLFYVLSLALLYRVMRRLRDERAALMIIIAFSALGYLIHASTEVRAYMLMITLLILAFWFVLRYFDYPSTYRALPLALAMAAAFYVYLPVVIGFFMLGLYTLIVYPRKIWRWWLPGLIAVVLALPLILNKLDDMAVRIAATDLNAPQTLLESVTTTFTEFTVYKYTDYPAALWVMLFVAATVIILVRRRFQPTTWVFFTWALLLPIFIYIVNPWLKFAGRYSVAIVIGYGIWVGWGLAYLPRPFFRVAALFLLALSFFPFQLHFTDDFWRPLRANFSWLSERLQPEDVVLIDPNGGVGKYYEWDYASRLYFPNGLHFVDDPAGYRRVWYITVEGQRDPATDQAVRQNRVEREFVGPARFFFRLYEAPPDSEGILFDNGMRFHGIDILSPSGLIALTGPLTIQHDFSTFRIRLWWSVDQPPSADYSIGTYLFFRDGMIDQVDGAPQTVSLEYPPNVPPSETSRWLPGRYYIEERELHIPDIIGANRYGLNIYLSVYQWWDNTRISAPNVDENTLLFLKRIYMETW